MSIDIEQYIQSLGQIIEQNNNLVKKGSSNSLENKYYMISKMYAKLINEFILDNQSTIVEQIGDNKNLQFIDVFAGSGNLTLMVVKNILKVCKENDKKIEKIEILLNDKLYEETKPINEKNLEKNFKEIINNLQSVSVITIKSFDIMSSDVKGLVSMMDKNSFLFVIANPMYQSLGKNKEHYKSISLINEDKFLNTKFYRYLRMFLLNKANMFMYLLKEKDTKISLDNLKHEKIYQNDYANFIINDSDKEIYRIFYPNDDLKVTDENIWKFNKNNKEKLNTIFLFIKDENNMNEKFLYIYNAIYNARKKRSLKTKLDELNTYIKDIDLDRLIGKYEDLKAKL
ncbi:hypothetical protein [Sulfurimonas sp.]